MSLYAGSAMTGDLLCPPLECDGELALAEIDASLWQWLLRCGPFGNAHPEPVFLSRGVTLASPVRLIKEKHICLEVTQVDGSRRLNALGWSRILDWPCRCRELDLQPGDLLDIAFRITENQHEQFGGLQLELVGLRSATPC